MRAHTRENGVETGHAVDQRRGSDYGSAIAKGYVAGRCSRVGRPRRNGGGNRDACIGLGGWSRYSGYAGETNGDCAEQAILLVIDSRGEVESIRITKSVGPEGQCVNVGIRDDVAVAIVDFAEIANQDIVAEGAEVGAGLSDSPRSVQSTAGCESPYEIAIHIEDIDDAVSSAHDWVVLGGILHRIGHEDLSSNHLNPERRVTGGQIRIRKRTGKSHSHESVKECIDKSTVEIGDRQRRCR